MLVGALAAAEVVAVVEVVVDVIGVAVAFVAGCTLSSHKNINGCK